MKAHNGMRPQDIVVLLKLISLGNSTWQQKDLANGLLMSNSEIAESLNRSQIAGLLDGMKKKVHRLSVMEFLEHGIKYVFPQLPGTLVTGLPTATNVDISEGFDVNAAGAELRTSTSLSSFLESPACGERRELLRTRCSSAYEGFA
jgi:hypothetical protein